MAKTIQIIPKNIIFPEARVLDKEDKELYQEADRKTAEIFGKDSRAYETITNGIDVKNVTGSQFFWSTNLELYLPKNEKVIFLEDMEAINDIDESFFRGFYTDAPEIILRTETPSWNQNKYILKNLVKQIKDKKHEFSSENPLRISDLELVKDNNSENKYGLLFKIGQDTRIINDKRFAYSKNRNQIHFGERTKSIWTKENGLSRVYLYRNSDLNSYNDDLAVSNVNGRVVLVGTEGVAPKNLESYINNLQKERDAQIEQIAQRYKQAEALLRGK